MFKNSKTKILSTKRIEEDFTIQDGLMKFVPEDLDF